MTVGIAWLLVGLGLGVVATRQRRLAVGLVTLQAAALVWLAVEEAGGATDLVAAAALAGRTLALAAFFLLLITRTRDGRPVTGGIPPLRRAGIAAALALALMWLVPPIGLASASAERAVLALVAFGLVVAATSRVILLPVLGIVVIENALVLAVLNLPGASWLIELGLAFDLMVIAVVAGVFHQRIFAEFGAGDTRALRSLRD